jgi:hypothetical protein
VHNNRKYHGVDKEVLWKYKIGQNEEIMRKFARVFMELTWKFYGNTQQGIIMEFAWTFRGKPIVTPYTHYI